MCSSECRLCVAHYQEKCEQYWPIAANEPRDVGCSLTVTLTEQIPLAEYQVKILKVENVRMINFIVHVFNFM